AVRLRGKLAGKWRDLAAALEADRPGRGEAQRVAVGVGDRDDGVVERRLDMGDAAADITPGLPLFALGHRVLLLIHPLASTHPNPTRQRGLPTNPTRQRGLR